MKILPQYRVTRNRAKTTQEFIHEFKQLNPDVIIEGNYINAHTPLKFICTKCCHQWYKTPNLALKYFNCSNCSGKYQYTPDEFKVLFDNLADKNLELLSDYVSYDIGIDCRCKICGYTFHSNSYRILHGTGCKKCMEQITADKKRRSQEDFEAFLFSKNKDLIVIGKYHSSQAKVDIKCKLCGNIFQITPSNLYKDNCYNFGCPECGSSKGEREIIKILNKYNIYYNSQKKFDNLLGVGGRNLSYDFYLPNYNLLIEFQGIQHEKPAFDFGGVKIFQKQLEHDKRKREYAINNNIDLLEIWYYDFENIEEILKKKLNLESVTTVAV